VPEDEGSPAIKVLIVDDHPMFADAVSALLTRDGRFEVVGTATQAAEAVELAARREPDVVLLDVTMPGEDGRDIARRVRKACPTTSVVILSAVDTDELQRAAEDADADAWLSKGGAHTDAADAIAAVVAERRAST
jgi:DNA-binding NarL/FixJ family response regulator